MRSVFFASIIAFAIAVLVGPGTIRYLFRLRFGQQVRSDGPQSHKKKQGTPTMGGILILLACVVATFVAAGSRGFVPYALLALVGFGLIGLVDDFIIVVAKRSLGLKARYKLIGQTLIALVVTLFALTEPSLGAVILVPFTDINLAVPSWIFVLLATTTIVGAANAVNLTDGLDGLAAGATAIAAFVYAAVALNVGAPEVAVFAGALGGACLGFSWFNAHPAQVFMGDTGSLALGAALGTIAVLTRTELFLPLIGGLFVIETLSVVIQVIFFRLTGGRRVFRMSPLHHHFELTGWAEPQVVIRFWLVGLVLGILGLIALPAI